MLLLSFLALMLVPTAAISLWYIVLNRLTRFAMHAYKVTGILGSPVHEFSHLVACAIFRFPIHSVSLYSPRSADGSLGHVTFSFDPRSLLDRFGMAVQGIAPLLSGIAIVSFGLNLPFQVQPLQTPYSLIDTCAVHALDTLTVLGNLATSGIPGFGLALVLLIVSMHSIPSWADIRVGMKGWVIIASAGLAVSVCAQLSVEYFTPPASWNLSPQLLDRVEKGIAFALASAVQLVALAIAGGLLLVVVPGWIAHVILNLNARLVNLTGDGTR